VRSIASSILTLWDKERARTNAISPLQQHAQNHREPTKTPEWAGTRTVPPDLPCTQDEKASLWLRLNRLTRGVHCNHAAASCNQVYTAWAREVPRDHGIVR